MSRMIEEQRVQIGTLKALGYNKIQISFKYLIYAFLATMIVKDVVQEMLDEDMIIQEKVGTNMLYWIFPSQSYMLVYTLFFMFIY